MSGTARKLLALPLCLALLFCLLPAACADDGAPDPAAEQQVWDDLVEACSKSYDKMTSYDIDGEHVFTIRNGLTIPENLSVFAIDSTFVVPASETFGIAGGGELIAGSLESYGNTWVDGSLDLEYDCCIPNDPIRVRGDIVMMIDVWVNLFEHLQAETPDEVAAKFSFESDGALLDIWSQPAEEEMSAALDFPMFHIPHIRSTICATFPWTLDHDRTLNVDQRLLFHYGGSATGMLTIPEGMVLTVPQGSELFARGAREGKTVEETAIVRVAGTLVNDGKIHLHFTRAGTADVVLLGKGICGGSGETMRLDESYTIWNNPESADFILPADLERIETQAFSGAGPRAVYIPAGVTSIPADAFGGREGLIVLGVPGSAAETLARETGAVFAPVRPAA